MESHQHLFFECMFPTSVWRKLLAWQGINKQVQGWEEEIKWTIAHANGRHTQDEIYRITLAATVYHLWLERNYRLFQKVH